jgi:AAA+ superfamily predicted ATPase
VTIFDLAMKSRIHLAIEYSPPELQMRHMIWTQYLKAIPSTEVSIDLESAVPGLVRDEVNGREIANAVHTARTLARFETQPLQLHHIQTVLRVRRDFDVSLAKKARDIEAAESRQGSIIVSNRKNSILVSGEQSQWLP